MDALPLRGCVMGVPVAGQDDVNPEYRSLVDIMERPPYAEQAKARQLATLKQNQPEPPVGADLHQRGPEPLVDRPDEEPRYRFITGGAFILDASETPVAVWGDGTQVLSAEGESTVIAAPQGTGKSTIAQQWALGRAGFPEYAKLLGYPVTPAGRRVLYLAMDRPRQIARSLRRMVGEAFRAELDATLSIWAGPPPYDMAQHPALLAEMARAADADTVVVDSLKDAAIGLTDDTVAAGWNRARQHALADGIQLMELHHNRKAPGGVTGKKPPPTIDDVYGSTWITSGAGSVFLIEGKAGDVYVKFHHVKSPLEPVGPLSLHHDHDHGQTSVTEELDLRVLVKHAGRMTAQAAAQQLFGTESPDRNQVEKVRRDLERLERLGAIRVLEPGGRGGPATVWGV